MNHITYKAMTKSSTSTFRTRDAGTVLSLVLMCLTYYIALQVNSSTSLVSILLIDSIMILDRVQFTINFIIYPKFL